MSENWFSEMLFILWLGGLCFFVLYLWPVEGKKQPPPPPPPPVEDDELPPWPDDDPEDGVLAK